MLEKFEIENAAFCGLAYFPHLSVMKMELLEMPFKSEEVENAGFLFLCR